MLLFTHNGSIKVSSIFASPVKRLLDTPEAGAATAALIALWQWTTGKPFNAAIALVIVTMVLDYIAGAVTAHRLGEYKSGIAYNGALSKIMGLVLILLVRGLEGFLSMTSFLNSNGSIATAAAVSLIAVDIVSISKHRQRLGGAPIPFIGTLMDWLQTAVIDKLPGNNKQRKL